MRENDSLNTARIYTVQLLEETGVKTAKVTADTVTSALEEYGYLFLELNGEGVGQFKNKYVVGCWAEDIPF